MWSDGGEPIPSGFQDVSAMLRAGVYILRHQGQVVYVGQSKTMLVRVYTHRNLARKRPQPWMSIRGVVFDEVLVKVVHPDQLDAVERALIERYRPRYNVVHNPAAPLVGIPNITRRFTGDSPAQPAIA